MITFITGCPCAGKSTYAQKIRENEPVWDWDTVVQAIYGKERCESDEEYRTIKGFYTAFCELSLRDDIDSIAVKTKLSNYEKEIIAEGNGQEKHLTVDKETALQRAKDNNRSEQTIQAIEEYFSEKQKGVRKMQKKSLNLEIKRVGDEESHSIVAYAATFHREPDSYGDVIRKGAFENTLKAWKESGNVIPLLFGHRMDDPLMNIGSVTSAEEDETGLKISATFDMDNERGAYVYKLVKEKRLTKLSFAFDVLDEQEVTLEDGVKANELRELSIYEVSLVPVPANSHATVQSVKSEKSIEDTICESEKLREIIQEEIQKSCYTQDSQSENAGLKAEVGNDKVEEQALLTAIDIELTV